MGKNMVSDSLKRHYLPTLIACWQRTLAACFRHQCHLFVYRPNSSLTHVSYCAHYSYIRAWDAWQSSLWPRFMSSAYNCCALYHNIPVVVSGTRTASHQPLVIVPFVSHDSSMPASEACMPFSALLPSLLSDSVSTVAAACVAGHCLSDRPCKHSEMPASDRLVPLLILISESFRLSEATAP